MVANNLTQNFLAVRDSLRDDPDMKFLNHAVRYLANDNDAEMRIRYDLSEVLVDCGFCEAGVNPLVIRAMKCSVEESNSLRLEDVDVEYGVPTFWGGLQHNILSGLQDAICLCMDDQDGMFLALNAMNRLMSAEREYFEGRVRRLIAGVARSEGLYGACKAAKPFHLALKKDGRFDAITIEEMIARTVTETRLSVYGYAQAGMPVEVTLARAVLKFRDELLTRMENRWVV